MIGEIYGGDHENSLLFIGGRRRTVRRAKPLPDDRTSVGWRRSPARTTNDRSYWDPARGYLGQAGPSDKVDDG